VKVWLRKYRILVALVAVIAAVLAIREWREIQRARVAKLMQRLEYGDETERARALEDLGALRGRRDIEALIPYLASDDPFRITQAAKALSTIGDGAAGPLIDSIHRAVAPRNQAVVAVYGWVERHLGLGFGVSDSRNVGGRIMTALTQMGGLGHDVAAKLMVDPDPSIRSWVPFILISGSPNMLDLCVDALKSSDANSRFYGLYGLRSRYYKPATEAILAASRDTSRDIRGTAADVLRAYVDDPRVVDRLIEIVLDGSETAAIRRTAVYSLARSTDRRALDTLLDPRVLGDAQLERDLAGALGTSKDPRRDATLAAAVRSEDQALRLAAIAVAGRSGRILGERILREGLAGAGDAARKDIEAALTDVQKGRVGARLAVDSTGPRKAGR
jgi:HEAT repeat protein